MRTDAQTRRSLQSLFTNERITLTNDNKADNEDTLHYTQNLRP